MTIISGSGTNVVANYASSGQVTYYDYGLDVGTCCVDVFIDLEDSVHRPTNLNYRLLCYVTDPMLA